MNFNSVSVKADDIGRFDDNAEDLGIPKLMLMECAGLQAVNAILNKYPLEPQSKIIIFAGTGNNGGDGFVIARHFASRGFLVDVYLCGSILKIRTNEAQLNWRLIKTLSLNIQTYEMTDSSLFNLDLKEKVNSSASMAIDALLGTGIHGKIREPIASAIQLFNSFTIPKISIDIPSGMDPDTGSVQDIAIECDHRITFHREKKGLDGSSSKDIVSIGIPPEAELYAGKGDLVRCFPKRKLASHKGNNGKVLVIGGSNTYSGAPSLAGLTAIELGLDLVIIFTPKSVANTIRSYSPNLIVRTGQNDNFSEDDLPLAKELCLWADSVIIGPGLGTSPETFKFGKKLINWLNIQQKPMVIDADGLSILSKLYHEDHFKFRNSQVVYTPHRGEFQKLSPSHEAPLKGNYQEVYGHIHENLHSLGGVCLLKGPMDYIVNLSDQTDKSALKFNPFSRIRINLKGCAAMTVGGTGDVLAGLVGSLLALGNDAFSSAISAAYLNGCLGEKSAREMGDRIKATDLIENIRMVLKNFFNQKNH